MENKKILVVDDEQETVRMLKQFLEKRGYDAAVAYNGEEALVYLSRNKTDLMLLDMLMPGIHGRDVAKIVKEEFPRTKVIVVTAFPEEGEKLAQDAIVEGFFEKPYIPEQLYNKVSKILPPDEKELCKHDRDAVKVNILCLEPDNANFKLIQNHFTQLSSQSERYQLKQLTEYKNICQQMRDFNPQILLLNSTACNEQKGVVSYNGIDWICPKVSILYTITGAIIKPEELAALFKVVKAAFFKNQ